MAGWRQGIAERVKLTSEAAEMASFVEKISCQNARESGLFS